MTGSRPRRRATASTTHPLLESTTFKGLPLEGALVTGDAIFTQREICRPPESEPAVRTRRSTPNLGDTEGKNMKKISLLLTVVAAATLATAADARPGHGRGY